VPYKDPIRRAEYGKKYRTGIPIIYERHRSLIKARKLREAVIVYLGSQCVQCGIADSRVLQVDHINGGGVKEKNIIGTYGIHRNVLNGTPGYQLLCANCNWIKRAVNKEACGRKRNG
jgi:hypothetical protein